MSFRNVDSPAAALEYVETLNQKWPARVTVMKKVAERLAALGADAPLILELCCGAGQLGHHLLTRLPHASYVGIDQSEPLLAAAEEVLLPFRERATLVHADLNQEGWHEQDIIVENNIHAVVSMQSLHDLGGEAEVSRIYKLAYNILPPNGSFINADLIVEPGEELPNNPGRLTVERHLALLAEYGFSASESIYENGGFGCIHGQK